MCFLHSTGDSHDKDGKQNASYRHAHIDCYSPWCPTSSCFYKRVANDDTLNTSEPSSSSKSSKHSIQGTSNEKTSKKNTKSSRSAQFHGGQEWSQLENFVEDFSVTTNGLGTPQQSLDAAKKALDVCHHYPAADQEPAKTSLARYLSPLSSQSTKENFDNDAKDVHQRLLLGNGASELIDLVTRMAPEGPWKPGRPIQYKEYERSAKSLGRTILSLDSPQSASLTCIVNPNNPTGEYFHIQELKQFIQDNVSDGTYVMVDESMQPWHSAEFHKDSLLSQSQWIKNLYETRRISVFIIHSWTKIWSCTGLRLGSVLCPTINHATEIKKVQVPWSVNVSALAFLHTVTTSKEDSIEYMQKTWELTTKWRKYLVDELKRLDVYCEWKLSGHEFLSWVWIDFKNESIAREAVLKARAAGVPVRDGIPGYSQPTCVRAAVREPKLVDVLIGAWKNIADSK